MAPSNTLFGMRCIFLRIVSLQKKDPTDVLERSAALAGDVHFVQPPRMRCPVCRNTDETKFVSEYRSGDIVCTTCGTVVVRQRENALVYTQSSFRFHPLCLSSPLPSATG